MKLVSFDIFDTILIRKCGRPYIVFHLLGRKLFSDDMDLRNAFVFWRENAERNLNTVNGEVTLKDIYSTADSSFLNQYSLDELMEAEKEMEAEQLTANLGLKDLIEKKREEGYKVAFISDMYLDSVFLRNVLMREGCLKEEDKLYVSCEKNARKSTGKLFDIVKQELRPDIWFHYGDNVWSDIKQAKRKGIKSVLIDTSFTPAEIEVEKDTSVESVFLAGLSRWTRLKYGNNPFIAIGADFVAPAFLPYVIFILSEAKRRNIKRLYFFSRDGYVLMKAAESMLQFFPDVEIKYLFVSRRALLLPYLHGRGKEAYLHAMSTVGAYTVDKQLAYLGTNREELKENFGIEFGYTKIKTINEQEDFLEKIFNSQFTHELQARASQQEELVVRYFRQEGLFENKKSAAVDLGWVGTTRLMINEILKKTNGEKLHVFYYDIRRDVFQMSVGGYTSYFNASGSKMRLAKYTDILEDYYAASPYPTTIGYQQNSKGVVCPLYPNGEFLKETAITENNINAIESIGNEILRYGIPDPVVLRLWAENTMRLYDYDRIKVNYEPFLACKVDGKIFAKKLTLYEILKVVLLDKHITLYDEMSLKLTVYPHLYPFVMNVKQRIGKLKKRLKNSLKFYIAL